MVKKIVMPSAGQTTDQLTIIKWLKSVGDAITRGDVLLEVETDKAVMPVESFTSGILLKTCFQEGDIAYVGDVLAYIGDETDCLQELGIPPLKSELVDNKEPESTNQPFSSSAAKPETQKPANADKRLRASPAAKKAAKDANVPLENLARITNGVIRKKHIQQYIDTQKQTSVNTIPSYTLEIEVDLSQLQGLLKRGLKTTIHDFITKCATIAANKYPLVKPSDTKETSITISNLDSYGIKRFTAIINSPEYCVLAVGAISNYPYLDSGVLKERPVISITATFDHRVVDSSSGASFLACLRDYIENPIKLALL